ncbi:cytochrome P450 [Amylostereum chailletii]|nr:cytochrome P450 [Amylostereum chailletii]
MNAFGQMSLKVPRFAPPVRQAGSPPENITEFLSSLSPMFWGALVVWLTAIFAVVKFNDSRLPPGPDGASTELRTASPSVVFSRWYKQYGAIFSFKLGTKTVVVGKTQAQLDLISHEILSGGMRGLSMPYGEHWRKWRKIQHVGMNGRAVHAYRDHQSLESTVVLRDLMADAAQQTASLRRFATSVVLGICYGRRVTDLEDEMVKVNYESLAALSSSLPGKYAVETYPFLLRLPRRFQTFLPPLEALRAKDTATYTSFFRAAKERIEAGTSKDCMASYCVTEKGSQGLSEVEISYALSAPFGAGVDTTLSSIQWGIIAALLFPSIAKKVQDELDTVVGRSRLPTFEDEKHLPYLNAFIKEYIRYWPVVPVAVPHATTRADRYGHYEIPAGATVYGNIDAIVKDPELFENPREFRPERFLQQGPEKLPPHLADFNISFGFGRRVCPGMHVALQSNFIVLARLLWAFDILPADDGVLPKGNEFANQGLTRGPAPFNFKVHPRHSDVVRIVEAEGSDADVRLKEWEYALA